MRMKSSIYFTEQHTQRQLHSSRTVVGLLLLDTRSIKMRIPLYVLIHTGGFMNLTTQTFALIKTPGKLFRINNLPTKSPEKSRSENIRKRRPRGFPGTHDEIYPAKLDQRHLSQIFQYTKFTRLNRNVKFFMSRQIK